MSKKEETHESVRIGLEEVILAGDLGLPQKPKGLVIFAHGSGSSRFSPRNKAVAALLNRAGFATLLFDLLTAEEEVADEVSRQYRFDIPLLATRLSQTTDWIKRDPRFMSLPMGYFGASTGAAAALIAAAEQTDHIKAVVSRGGRPDLAGSVLLHVKAPVLLIVGGFDPEVIELNQAAQSQLYTKSELKIIPGATHLFEEPGTMDQVTALTIEWFRMFLRQ